MRQPPRTEQEAYERTLEYQMAQLHHHWVLLWLPLGAWLCRLLGLQLKPKYQAMLDERPR